MAPAVKVAVEADDDSFVVVVEADVMVLWRPLSSERGNNTKCPIVVIVFYDGILCSPFGNNFSN